MSVAKNPISHPDHFSFEDAIIYNALTHEPQTVEEIIADIRDRIVVKGFYLEQHIYRYAANCKKEDVVRRLENMKEIVHRNKVGKYYVMY
jgi:hypothetical protein